MILTQRKGVLRAIGLGLNNDPHGRLSLKVRGEAELAELIVSLANKHGVPVIERKGVYDILADLQIDEVVPTEYHALIEVLRAEIQKDLR